MLWVASQSKHRVCAVENDGEPLRAVLKRRGGDVLDFSVGDVVPLLWGENDHDGRKQQIFLEQSRAPT